MDSEYELWQFHAHWGSDNSKGSEHTIDGKEYASEVSIYENERSVLGLFFYESHLTKLLLHCLT